MWGTGAPALQYIATIVGAFKEYVYDYRWKKGTPEHMDFIVTVLGGILAFALMVF